MAVFQEGLLPLLVEADLLSFTIFQKGYVAISHIYIESSIMTSLSAFGVVSDLLFETFIEEKG